MNVIILKYIKVTQKHHNFSFVTSWDWSIVGSAVVGHYTCKFPHLAPESCEIMFYFELVHLLWSITIMKVDFIYTQMYMYAYIIIHNIEQD